MYVREGISVLLCWGGAGDVGGVRCGVLLRLGSLGAHAYGGRIVDDVGMSRAGSW